MSEGGESVSDGHYCDLNCKTLKKYTVLTNSF